jgi:hypothetical protein
LRKEHPSVNQVLIGFLAEELDRQNELLLARPSTSRWSDAYSVGSRS